MRTGRGKYGGGTQGGVDRGTQQGMGGGLEGGREESTASNGSMEKLKALALNFKLDLNSQQGQALPCQHDEFKGP